MDRITPDLATLLDCTPPPARPLAALIDGIPQPVLLIDAGLAVRQLNGAARRRLGLVDAPARGAPLGRVLEQAGEIAPAEAAVLLAQARAIVAAEEGAARGGGAIRLTGRRLSPRLWMLTLAPPAHPAFSPAGRCVLTGLADRAAFAASLARLLQRAEEPAAVLLVDLDRFKSINDTLGHPVGDALLAAVAGRLRGCIRPRDLAARLGGDEFAILLPGCAGEADAALLARRVVEILSRPFLVRGHLASIGASVGVALAPADAAEADELVRAADLALYQAKAEGRGIWRRFRPALNERAQARRALEADLRRALPLRQFHLHYQPQVALPERRLTGFEALLRWTHPARGSVPPGEFIPLAEEVGLIGAIGGFVLRAACAEAAAWPEPLKVAVNVSPLQFERGAELVAAVTAALAESGLPGVRLELEITESALLHNEASTLATLHALRGLGVRIAMDDFGTGYSSLSQLRSFPFDKVKIDRSFVSGLAEGGQASAIVRAITALGASLGIATIAEGVETEAQAAALVQEGCGSAQGYLISRPVAPENIPALIARAGSGAATEFVP